MRNYRFTFVQDEDEHLLLNRLASIFNRSKSDTVRHLIHKEAKELGVVEIEKEVHPINSETTLKSTN